MTETTVAIPSAGAATTYDWVVQFSASAMDTTTTVADTAGLFATAPMRFDVVRGLGQVGEVLVRSYNADVDTVRDWLAANASISAFLEDGTASVDAAPNDPQYASLWGIQTISSPAAWDVTTGSSNVIVAVIDSGVQYDHPDLAANMWRNPGETPGDGLDNDHNGFIDDVFGWDFVDNDNTPSDPYGHGTHVAGTIGATGNNATGVVGVTWDVQIMALRFINASGSGNTSNAIAAINYATMMKQLYGQNVVASNNSWGASVSSYPPPGQTDPLLNAINAGGQQGILFVAAAGNSSQNIDTAPDVPAGYNSPYIISVAASGSNDALASFSNYGATNVDLAAPGVSILSTYKGSTYATLSGTSMASPHVAGVVALAAAASPTSTALELRSAILAGVDQVSSLTGKVATGGRLNAAKVVRSLVAPTLAPLADQQFPASQDSLTVALQATDPNAGDTLTYSASLIPQGSLRFNLDSQYGFFLDSGGYYANNRGQSEKYLRAQVSANGYTAGTPWYYILPSGDLYEFTPPYTNRSLTGVLLGNVGVNVYNSPTLLVNASETESGTTPPVTLSISGNQLVINPAAGYTGTFRVTARVTDAAGHFTEQTFSVTVTPSAINYPPTLAAVPDQLFSTSQDFVTIPLAGSDPNVGDILTYSASLVPQNSPLYNLDNQYGFFTDSKGYYTNNRGQNEKYLRAQVSANGYTAGTPWYYILPNGDLYEFTPSYTNRNLVGVRLTNVGVSVYADPTLLTNATQTGGSMTPPVTLSIIGNQLKINPDTGYTGTFQVTARVTDAAGLFAERTFPVTVTQAVINQPPTLAPVPVQQIPTTQDSLTIALVASDPNPGDLLTYSASLVKPNPALYDLDSQYGFFADAGGYYTNNRKQNEKYLRGQVSANGYTAGTPWYYILPNGDLYEFTPSYTNRNLVGVFLANVGTSVYSDPSLLINAAVPVALSMSGNQLTINPAAGYMGTFQVLVRVTDSAGLYAEQTVNVTVTSGAAPMSLSTGTLFLNRLFSPDASVVVSRWVDVSSRSA